MVLKRWSRKLHRWGAIITAVPVLVVIVTGLLLQLKKEVAWVQPPTARGSGEDAQIAWPEILRQVQTVPAAEVRSWEDIDRLDVRPDRGLIKVRCRNHWEVQLDWSTGAVLQTAYRRSDWIESLHDGSFFGGFSKYYIFLPSGLILFGLWLTGAYLWYLPIMVKQQKSKRRQRQGKQLTEGKFAE